MARNDKIEDIEDRLEVIERERDVSKRVRAICITATTALLSVFYTIGQWAYTRWDAMEAGIRAFWAAGRQ